MADKFKYCENFCPLYQAIEEFNRDRTGEMFDCSKAKIDCQYIIKVAKDNRGKRG